VVQPPDQIAADVTVSTRTPTSVVPGYEILSELGRGGMGVVYLARQVALDRDVALKMVLAGELAGPAERVRFRTEAEAIARLQHPNVVQIFEVGEAGGRPFCSLEYCPGGSLDRKLQGTPLPPAEAARLVETLARAVQAAHDRGIIHRDLKPANVLLAADGTPKVSDFGLAKRLDAQTVHTASGAILGTPPYMAPEQASGAKTHPIGPATDIYALGAVLYECLTGRPPFRAPTPLDTMFQVLNQDPVAPRQLQPNLSRDLETICLKCLEKDPKRRYPSALELAEDLNRFLQGEPIHARPIRTWEKGLRLVKRHPALAALAAGVTVLILTASAAGIYIRIQRTENEKMELALIAEKEKSYAEEERRKWEAMQGLQQQRDAIRDVIAKGDQAVLTKEWNVARSRFEAAISQSKVDPNLVNLGREAELKLKGVRSQLDALSEQDRFCARENEALFMALGPSALGRRARQKAIRAQVTDALNVVHVSPDTSGTLDVGAGYTKDAREEVAQGCFQLLALLAESVSQPLPGQTREEYQTQQKEAIHILDRAASLTPSMPLMRSYHLRRANCLEVLKQDADVRAERKLAAKLEAKTRVDFFLLGEQRFQEGDPDGAANWFETALSYRSEFWPRYLLAQCYMQQAGEISQATQRQALFDRAREQLDTCLASQHPEPARVWILLVRGTVYANMNMANSYDQANKDFDAALAILKNKADDAAMYALLNNRGIMQVERRNYSNAIQDLERAIRVHPKQFQAYLSLAKVYDEQAKQAKTLDDRQAAFAKAEAEFRRALDVAAQQVKDRELDVALLALLYRNVGAFHQQHRQPERALKDFESAVAVARQNVPAGKRLPDDPTEREALARGHFDCGRVHQTQKRYPEAVQAFDRAIDALRELEQGPQLLQRWGVYRWRGDAQMQMQDYEGAVASYDHYLRRGFFRYPIGGLFALGSGGPLHAVLLLDIRLQYRAGGRLIAEIFRARGFSRMKLNQFEAAVEDYDYALELEPEDWASYAQRGRCFLVLSRYAPAEHDFHRALALNPRKPDLYTGRALARVKLGRVPDAIGDTKEALRLARTHDAEKKEVRGPAEKQSYRAAKNELESKRPAPELTPALLYQATCVYAQAAGQRDNVLTPDQRATDLIRNEYLKESLELLRQAIEATPPSERTRFWLHCVQIDRRLDVIRSLPEFRQLDPGSQPTRRK
jgi:serine/threonine protein kinase/Tfp pilus assembly protein PilF